MFELVALPCQCGWLRLDSLVMRKAQTFPPAEAILTTMSLLKRCAVKALGALVAFVGVAGDELAGFGLRHVEVVERGHQVVGGWFLNRALMQL